MKNGPLVIFQGFTPKILVKLVHKPFLIESGFRGQLDQTDNLSTILK